MRRLYRAPFAADRNELERHLVAFAQLAEDRLIVGFLQINRIAGYFGAGGSVPGWIALALAERFPRTIDAWAATGLMTMAEAIS
jgi:hypothetical protein